MQIILTLIGSMLCNMYALLVLLSAIWFPAIKGQDMANPISNLTNSTNDMYVIHATVYQVGIITNKSDDEIANMTGNQEALSFYHNNGSAVDLSAIPVPLMTNVTALSAVAVAPVQPGAPPDTSLEPPLLTSGKKSPTVKRSGLSLYDENFGADDRSDMDSGFYVNMFKRAASSTGDVPAIKVVKETSLIPPEVGLKSIGLPELVGLNTSVASIPLPIPNTSVVRYSKVNTLVKTH